MPETVGHIIEEMSPLAQTAATAPQRAEVAVFPGAARIERQGIYPDITLDAYHGREEICPDFSVSGSFLKAFADCPESAWWNSRLNPAWEPVKQSRNLNYGAAVHDAIALADWQDRYLILPEKFSAHHVNKFAEFMPEYEAGLAAGKIPLKSEDLANIGPTIERLRREELVRNLYTSGMVEVTLAHQDESTGIWIRSRPDFLPAAHRIIPDYKTAFSVRPDDFQKAIANYRYHWSAALIEAAIRRIYGEAPHSFVFIAQEKKAPFVPQIFQLDPEALAWGRIEVRRTLDNLARLRDRPGREWPSYTEEEIVVAGLPRWSAVQLEQAAERGEIPFPKGDEI